MHGPEQVQAEVVDGLQAGRLEDVGAVEEEEDGADVDRLLQVALPCTIDVCGPPPQRVRTSGAARVLHGPRVACAHGPADEREECEAVGAAAVEDARELRVDVPLHFIAEPLVHGRRHALVAQVLAVCVTESTRVGIQRRRRRG